MIDANTKPTILVGNPVCHSKSPLFQNEAFKTLNINSVYLAINIEKNDFDVVISGLKKIDIFGMNITIPYKVEIMKFVDEFASDAKKIGAINTIEVVNKKWIGHNTDWFGVYKTLEINNISNNQNVLIIGAGGATNGLVYGLQEYGIKNIVITNRTNEKAELIKNQFNIDHLDYKTYRNKLQFFSMIINTTSIDFKELLPKFEENKTYFDLKYYSEKPQIKNYIDGKDMLLYQGAKAFEIWTKKAPPIDLMRKFI